MNVPLKLQKIPVQVTTLSTTEPSMLALNQETHEVFQETKMTKGIDLNSGFRCKSNKISTSGIPCKIEQADSKQTKKDSKK